MAHNDRLCEVLRRTDAGAHARDGEREDLAAVLSSHTGAESVIALSLENARLKCTLHGGYLSIFV